MRPIIPCLRLNLETGTRSPEASNSAGWADDMDGRTEGILDLWSGVETIPVRRRRGPVLITDGPFTETKE